MGENFVDFRIIKQTVPITSVLERYRIALRKVNQHSLRGRCPLPTHSSDKSSESFGVHIDKNIWACQSTSCSTARQGKRGGNVIDFVAAMERCSVRDAALKLHDWFVTVSTTSASISTPSEKEWELVAENRNTTSERGVNAPLTFTLKNVDTTHSYLRQRSITEETARTFEVGYFPGRGSMSEKVVIPIHNERGELVAYAGRSIDNSEPKYKLPTGFQKSKELFNLHRALAATGEQVIIVEGFFDCMKVHQAGFPNVVALMGSSLSDDQQKLFGAFKAAILFLDGDDAGRGATRTISERLVRTMFVKVVDVPSKQQPDQLSTEEIRKLLAL